MLGKGPNLLFSILNRDVIMRPSGSRVCMYTFPSPLLNMPRVANMHISASKNLVAHSARGGFGLGQSQMVGIELHTVHLDMAAMSLQVMASSKVTYRPCIIIEISSVSPSLGVSRQNFSRLALTELQSWTGSAC